MKSQRLYLVMKAALTILALLWVHSVGCRAVAAQTLSGTTEIEQLKMIVGQQQRALEHQQAQILALQSAVVEQNKILVSLVPAGGGAKLVLAVDRAAVSTTNSAMNSAMNNAAESAAVSTADRATYNATGNDLRAERELSPVPTQQLAPLTPKQEQVQEELQRGPEIADVTPTTPAIELGPAKIRLIGYPALTSVWRSSNNGGNVATNFNNIPYDNTVPGTTSEFRLSPQNTRLAIRVDADLKSSVAAGYFEMDFVGAPVGGNLVTQSGYPFRIRQAWFDWRKGNWEMTAGQLWSLMTPNKEGILPWPGDVAVTQVLDLNFVAGIVVGRYPQFRVVYRPSSKMSFGFSVENPEQQVNSSVVFPNALSGTLGTQYNTGGSGLNVPNMTPDFVLKGSFDDKVFGDRKIHFDVGTVMRTFRSWDGSSASGKDYAFGWGVGANFNVQVAKKVRWVLDGFAGDGTGRYIGGLAPDVIVKANGSISPIHSYSWVSGFEIAPSKATGFYFYYSGLYAQKNSTPNSDGTCCVGFGFPGASTAADRSIAEATGGYSRVVWSHEGLGSVQWGLQYGYVWANPWVAGTGPRSAHSNLVFSQVRFNLP